MVKKRLLSSHRFQVCFHGFEVHILLFLKVVVAAVVAVVVAAVVAVVVAIVVVAVVVAAVAVPQVCYRLSLTIITLSGRQ